MPLFEWEKSLFLLLQGSPYHTLNQFMIFISSFTPWLPIAGLLLFFVYQQQSRRNFFIVVGYVLLLMALSDSSTSYFFKNLFSRLRPCHMPELKDSIIQFGQHCGGKNGFFSSHAANSFALGSFLMAFGVVPKWLKSIVWIFLFLIAYSRVFLGVHLPLDVIVGAIWGLLLSQLWILLAKRSFTEPVSS